MLALVSTDAIIYLIPVNIIQPTANTYITKLIVAQTLPISKFIVLLAVPEDMSTLPTACTGITNIANVIIHNNTLIINLFIYSPNIFLLIWTKACKALVYLLAFLI